MQILVFIKSLFADPSFEPGERVNQLRGGSMARTDGFVVAQTDNGVLVEWPTGGSSLVAASELTAIS